MNFEKYIRLQPQILTARELRLARDKWSSARLDDIAKLESMYRDPKSAVSAAHLEAIKKHNEVITQIIKQLRVDE